MAFWPLEGRRYDMPALFGPSSVPDKTVIEDAHAIVLSAPISRDAAETLLPNQFRSPDAPVLSLAYVQYNDVDYLGGRGYNEIVVTVSAIHEGNDGTIAAAYAPVLWVNKAGALIAGREFMGLPKLLGNIPDSVEVEGGYRFSCFEEDALLLQGEATDLAPLAAPALDRVNARAGEVRTFGWKYIPGPNGSCDVDYPLVNVMRWNYRTAATGRGALTFAKPSGSDAPFSEAAIATLRGVPLQGEIRAFYGRGEATIDRQATRRIA
ncbi:acetoacetate decarboxylase family protein [Rhizorhabdus argentea]|uniref:acetoacetate decarboxylase family protein n=1 Tax=Rhizorhabdus argentea TaxID=1387174 RepID=UPI0030EE0C28